MEYEKILEDALEENSVKVNSTNSTSETELFRTEKIPKILLKIAPPVMLAQLIQAMYNIVDSYFVGKYSESALTALSVIYPLQLIIIALAVGTGVGVNTYMARLYAQKMPQKAEEAAGTGMVLALGTWFIFAILAAVFMKPYVQTGAKVPEAVDNAIIYGRIVCIGSIGAFLEGNWTKVHQSRGNMSRPMIAQTVGALTNIILDPILIFGAGPVPGMGVAGAAYATVIGQIAAAVITAFGAVCRPPELRKIFAHAKQIYWYGYASIMMQALYTVYIVILNAILAGFSDSAVTVLGLYYKLQTFFFIPLMGLQTCIVPLLSFNYTTKSYSRCRETMKDTYLFSCVFMLLGVVCFVLFPTNLLRIFSESSEVISIGKNAFPIIGASFIPAVFSLMTPVFFQAIGNGKVSLFLSVMRQILCLVPIFWLLSLIGLKYVWFAFPISEVIVGVTGMVLYAKNVKHWSGGMH